MEEDEPADSWFLRSLRHSSLAAAVARRGFEPLGRWLDRRFNRPPAVVPSLEPAEGGPGGAGTGGAETGARGNWPGRLAAVVLALAALYGAARAALLLLTLPPGAWASIGIGAAATFLRVTVAVALGLAWTVPAGVLIGTNRRAAMVLQPVVEVLAAIPATALFPVLLLGLVNVRGGPDLAAVLLMLLGTQWYLLFNVIAGASSIPQDLVNTTNLMRLGGWRRWRNLILPALFPYLVTGLITASGGAWNASIVAEYTTFGGRVNRVTGLGALITSSTAGGHYALLLGSTVAMIALVVTVNRVVWRRLYRLAEERFRLDQ